jgi:hypothetical protein
MPPRFIRAPAVASRTGHSVRTVKRKAADPRDSFPCRAADSRPDHGLDRGRNRRLDRSRAAAAPVPPRTRGAPRIWRCRSLSAPSARLGRQTPRSPAEGEAARRDRSWPMKRGRPWQDGPLDLSARLSSPPLRHRKPRRHRAAHNMRWRHLVRRLHALGPRPTAELLLELARAHGIGELDPELVAALGGRDWPPPPLTLVAGGWS